MTFPSGCSAPTRDYTSDWNESRTYDNVGNVLSLRTTLPTVSGGSQTENQSFCYDELNRLVWAGNSGNPTGGDHCGLAPTGTTVSPYQQSFSYDALDRLTNGPSGAETYGSFSVHAATTLSTVPNQYASYDAMGNMTCRNVDPSSTSTASCGSAQSGATMTYDNEGRLTTWKAPAGSSDTDQFLYDNEGHRVLQRASSSGAVSDTISFDGYTDVTVSGSTTSTTKYYSVGGQKVAMRKDGTFSYLLPNLLGSSTVALTNTGAVEGVQLFAPFGSTNYSDGTMPSPFSFTGQRLDSQTGLFYYGSRYYDPASGRFISADTIETNLVGQDAYAYVAGNPETFTDPTGQYMILGGGAGRAWVNNNQVFTESAEGDRCPEAIGSFSSSSYSSYTPYAEPIVWEPAWTSPVYEPRVPTSHRSGRPAPAKRPTPKKSVAKPKQKSTAMPLLGGMLGAQYLFRGTSLDYPGNASLQRIGITPASTNPAVAAVFGTESENYGQGVVHIAQVDQDLNGVPINSGNVLSRLEQEVGVETSPTDFANRASITISSSDARGILGGMGVSIPSSISRSQQSQVISDLPTLSDDQINQFVSEAQFAQMESEMSTMQERNTMEDLTSFEGE